MFLFFAAPCTSLTVPDFLTADTTHCYDEQPLDICTPYNANDTEKVREQINCTNYDVSYKVLRPDTGPRRFCGGHSPGRRPQPKLRYVPKRP
ncbi:hypothetical protein MRX96_050111 [Rhipicephalus microplus]